MSNAIQPIEAL